MKLTVPQSNRLTLLNAVAEIFSENGVGANGSQVQEAAQWVEWADGPDNDGPVQDEPRPAPSASGLLDSMVKALKVTGPRLNPSMASLVNSLPQWIKDLDLSDKPGLDDAGRRKMEDAFNAHEGFTQADQETEQFHSWPVKNLEIGMLTRTSRITSEPVPEGDILVVDAIHRGNGAVTGLRFASGAEIDVVCPGCTVGVRHFGLKPE